MAKERVASWGDFDVHFGDVLGRGGMGTVYRAWQRSVGRWTAVKVLEPARDDDADLQQGFLERFRVEIQALARLNDPRIITLHAAGRDEERLWYAMELVEGETVERRLSREGAFSEEAAARVGVEVGRALAAALRQGIFHRDVKPANIFLLPDGSVKLADFGLARGRELARTRLTDVDALACTPEYASPEQGDGRVTDHRSDLYSLGCVLFEMATEQPPFSADAPLTVLYKHATEPVPSARLLNPRISPEFEAVLKRCLEKDPGERFQDYESFIAALEAAGSPAAAVPLPRRSGRRRAGSLAAAVLLVMAGIVWMRSGGEGSPAAPERPVAPPLVDLAPPLPPAPAPAPAPVPQEPAPEAPPPVAGGLERELEEALGEAEQGRFRPLAALRVPEAPPPGASEEKFRRASSESAAAVLLMRGDAASLGTLLLERPGTLAARRAALQALDSFHAALGSSGHELVGEIPWGTWTADVPEAGSAGWDGARKGYAVSAPEPGTRTWIKRHLSGAQGGWEARFRFDSAGSPVRLAASLNFKTWIEVGSETVEAWSSGKERPRLLARRPGSGARGVRTLTVIARTPLVLVYLDGALAAALREPEARLEEGLQIGAGGGGVLLESVRVKDRDP